MAKSTEYVAWADPKTLITTDAGTLRLLKPNQLGDLTIGLPTWSEVTQIASAIITYAGHSLARAVRAAAETTATAETQPIAETGYFSIATPAMDSLRDEGLRFSCTEVPMPCATPRAVATKVVRDTYSGIRPVQAWASDEEFRQELKAAGLARKYMRVQGAPVVLYDVYVRKVCAVDACAPVTLDLRYARIRFPVDSTTGLPSQHVLEMVRLAETLILEHGIIIPQNASEKLRNVGGIIEISEEDDEMDVRAKLGWPSKKYDKPHGPQMTPDEYWAQWKKQQEVLARLERMEIPQLRNVLNADGSVSTLNIRGMDERVSNARLGLTTDAPRSIRMQYLDGEPVITDHESGVGGFNSFDVTPMDRARLNQAIESILYQMWMDEEGKWHLAQSGGLMAASVFPGVGEALDLYELCRPGAPWWSRVLAGGSLALSAVSFGFLPNWGSVARSADEIADLRRLVTIQGNGDEILVSSRIFGITEGSVYAAEEGARWFQRMGRVYFKGRKLTFIFEGDDALKVFSRHPIEGPYSWLKYWQRQYKSAFGDIVLESFDAITRIDEGIVIVTKASLDRHLGHSTALAFSKLWGRRVGLDFLILYGAGRFLSWGAFASDPSWWSD